MWQVCLFSAVYISPKTYLLLSTHNVHVGNWKMMLFGNISLCYIYIYVRGPQRAITNIIVMITNRIVIFEISSVKRVTFHYFLIISILFHLISNEL